MLNNATDLNQQQTKIMYIFLAGDCSSHSDFQQHLDAPNNCELKSLVLRTIFKRFTPPPPGMCWSGPVGTRREIIPRKK